MTIAVILGGAVLTAALLWFFFGLRGEGRADLHGDVQEATVVVRGGYAPSALRVRQGVPLRLLFDRQSVRIAYRLTV